MLRSISCGYIAGPCCCLISFQKARTSSKRLLFKKKNENDMVLLHHVVILNTEMSPSLTHIHSYPKGQIFPFKTEQILNLKNKLLVLYKDYLFVD